jgi:hypothetical protein
MDLTPLHMQVAGVAIIVAMGLGFLFWTARAMLGLHRGYPVYVLPDPDHDSPDDLDPLDA